ncbi:MAG TPA: hypothetical protein PLN21_14790 [Gemmatales bacterium]|nr:hypothetical protein [Gemmatales bacterium]
MRRWTVGATLWVIGLGAVLTVSPLMYSFVSENSWGELFTLQSCRWLAWGVLPSALLLASSLLRRKLPWVQILVAVAAVVLMALLGGIYWYEVAHHIRGNQGSFGMTPGSLLFLYGPVAAVPILLIAAAAALWDWSRRAKTRVS